MVQGKLWRRLVALTLLSHCSLTKGQCTSSIADSDRVDCHPEPGATEAKCRCKGCRWCIAAMPGKPYCFHETEQDILALVSLRASCPSCSNCMERVDCHPEPGADSEGCVSRGCLWCPEAPNSEPWCIYGGVNTIDSYRTSCKSCDGCNKSFNCLPGISNPTESQCKGKGCQWCPALTPKCSYGGSKTAPVQHRENCLNCTSCSMPYDCHPEPGATQAECESRQCIWCVSQIPGRPWCLYGGTSATICNTCSNCNTKIDCHPEPHATKFSCEDRGCMWCPTARSEVPFCFYPSV